MNRTIGLNEATLRTDYYRYRAFIVPSAVLFACILLFIYVIIPQIQGWLMLQGQIVTLRNKVQTINQDLSNLSSVSDPDLDAKLTTVAKALPVNKDLIAILGALNTAGIGSGVTINDYTVQDTGATMEANNQTTQLTININGSLSTIKKFITALKNQLPLADVTELRSTNDMSTVTVAFFFSPVPHRNFDESQMIRSLSPADITAINTLSSLDKNNSGNVTLPQLTSPQN